MLKRALAGLVFCLLSGTLAAQAGQFLEAPSYITGTNPRAAVVGDFNGDGIPDLAVANAASNTVSVLLGQSGGTFSPKVDYAVGSAPEGIAVGDFNGDGYLDIAVTNSGSKTVSILLNNGNGTFQNQVTYATGRGPQGIAVGDFTGSGVLDLAVVNSTDATMSILLGTGTGTFGTQTTYNTGTNPYGIAVGDLSNNGILDIAVANNNSNNQHTVSVFMGNGNGTFQDQFQYPAGDNPVSIAVADFNGDGNLDLVVADQADNAVSILLGTGTGSFQAPVEYSTGASPTSVVVGDFTGSGTLDLAVASSDSNTITILWGVGNGTFAGYLNLGVGDIPYSVVAADFNGDGNLDLAVTNSVGNTVSLVLNNGNQVFQSRIDYPAGPIPAASSGPTPFSIATADFNGDGIPDLAMANSNCPSSPCGPGAIEILLGNGDGTFQGPTSYSTGTDTDPQSVVAGNFGNGFADLAVANYATNTVGIMLGAGNGTFGTPTTYAVGDGPTSVVTGNFTGNGTLGLVATNFHSNNVSVLLGNGNGTFQSAVNYSVGKGPVAVAAAAFSSNQIVDLAVVNETDATVSILMGNGNGTFQSQVTYSTGTGGNPIAIAVGDFNGDGNLDLAVANSATQQVGILLGNGNGTFQAVKTYAVGANPYSIVVADFNGNGTLDLALSSLPVGSSPGNSVSLLMGNGDGTFGSPTLFGVGYLAYAATVADFNGDGTQDIAVANAGSNTVSILLNSQGTTLNTESSSNPSTFGQSVTITATVAAGVPNGITPTGTVTLMNGSSSLGTGTLVNGETTVATSALPVGTETLSVVYSGDSNYQPHTVTLSQTVQIASTNTALASSLNPSTESQAITLTATVTSNTGATPAGTVNFLNGSSNIGSSTLNAGGSATLTISTLSVGTNSITAAYAGNSNFSASTSGTVSQVVQKANSTTSLTASPMSANVGQSVTLTATVSSGFSPTPTGTVTFLNGSTELGSSALNANGVATLSTTSLPAGTDGITASYSGDSNFNLSISAVVDVTITGPGFTLSIGTFSPPSISPGGSATTTVTITPSGGFNPSGVTLTCAVAPSVKPPVNCSVGAISVTNNVGTATITATTTGPQSALAMPGAHAGMRWVVALMIPGILFGGAGFGKRTRKKLLSLCLLSLVLFACLFGVACVSSGNNSNNQQPGTPAGTYSVTITGTASGVTTPQPQSTSLTVQ